MTEPADRVAAIIADNVRSLRARRGLTLDGLAARTGLSKGTLVALEQARANPSIGTLCQLTESLGIGLNQILEDRGEPFVKVRTADSAALLWSTGAGSGAWFLIGTDPPDGLELWRWRIVPGDAFGGTAHPAGTREVLQVTAGELAVHIAERVTHLHEGDALVFEATAPHRYECAGDTPVEFTMTVLVTDVSGLGPMGDRPVDGDAPG